MPYEARVRQAAKVKTVRFSGDFEYVLYEWRHLPDNKYDLARNNPHLETRSVAGGPEIDHKTATVEDVLMAGIADETLEEKEPETPKKTTRRRSRKARK